MINRQVFFTHARARPFNGTLQQSQTDGLNFLLDEWVKTGFTDLRWLGYALATTFKETGRAMKPVREVGQGRGHAYGIPTGRWHNVYYGRGDAQTTWVGNYAKASQLLGEHGIKVDLAQFPEMMLNPTIAAAVLYFGMETGMFTGKKFSDYFSGVHGDPINARRIINGLDCAHEVATDYFGFMAAINAATV